MSADVFAPESTELSGVGTHCNYEHLNVFLSVKYLRILKAWGIGVSLIWLFLSEMFQLCSLHITQRIFSQYFCANAATYKKN